MLEIVNKDASDLCDKGLLQAMVKLSQHLLHHLKSGFVFPLALDVRALGCPLIQMGFVVLTPSPFQTLPGVFYENGLLALENVTVLRLAA